MDERERQTGSAEIKLSREEALSVASLLRYAASLNTTVGLVSPTERRLASPTYRAIELAALVLEGKTFDEAISASGETWTGSLQQDHQRSLEMIETSRKHLEQVMTGRVGPDLLSEYLEISQDQFLELARSGLTKPTDNTEPGDTGPPS